MSGITDFLIGKPDRNVQQSLLTGGQNDFLSQLIQQLTQMGGQGGGMGNAMNILQQYLDPNSEIYKNFEQPYLNEFNQQTVPGLAERFAGYGSMSGALSSGGFGQALGAAGGNLQANLAQMKTGMQRSAVGDFLNQFNTQGNQALGTRAFENQYQPGSTGLVGQVLPAVVSGLTGGAGLGLANYAGNRFFGGGK